MISCTVRYEIDPDKLPEFEAYARFWLRKVPELGGVHHGYHLPFEGPNDIAYCHFSFDSLADYEAYRARMWDDQECLDAYEVAKSNKCILRYDRSFTRPIMPNTDA
ncbi:MAG: NIPSNAP family protein [Gammaproteobacteria bacterium]